MQISSRTQSVEISIKDTVQNEKMGRYFKSRKHVFKSGSDRMAVNVLTHPTKALKPYPLGKIPTRFLIITMFLVGSATNNCNLQWNLCSYFHFSTWRAFLITSQRKARKSTKATKRGEDRHLKLTKERVPLEKHRFVTR